MAEKKSKSGSKKKEGITLEVQLPEGVQASIDNRKITVKGPQGQLTKAMQSRTVSAKMEENKIILTASQNRRKQRALINTEKGNVLNMIHGVKDKVNYRLKICYSHFPMGVKLQGNILMIDNFLGEKHPRKASILEGVKVDVKGQDVVLSGLDKDKVAQTAANIEQTTRIKNLDPRVFQDGIYIVEKDGKPVR
ncbi:MAG: 50S ribosomal protein L6 [Candidatus Altiarchaeales archaeon]|nr:50S ribosomal protein L6 [Candidatus Altiarchaeales archaeon]